MTIDNPANARSRRTRDGLLRAARVILEDEGFERLTMAAVAHRARVTRKAVYLHFPSRRELVCTLVEYVADQEGLAESLRVVFDAPDAIDMLNRWSRHLAGYGLRLLPETRAMERVYEKDSDVARYRELIVSAQRESCRKVIERLAGAGLLEHGWTVQTATDMLWALGSAAMLQRLVSECGWSPQGYAEHLSAILRTTFVVRGESA